MNRKLIAGSAALLLLAVIATGAILWERRNARADDPAAAAASEVEKTRNALPSTTQSSSEPTADDIPSTPPRGTIDPGRDHGNAENAGNWVMDGFNAADPKACNTFTAAAPFVA